VALPRSLLRGIHRLGFAWLALLACRTRTEPHRRRRSGMRFWRFVLTIHELHVTNSDGEGHMLSSLRFVWAYRLTCSRMFAALTLMSALTLVLATTQVARAQTLTALHSFDSTDGSEPIAGLIQGTTDSITAVYNGSGSFSGSTSPVLSEAVN
jgi:hypothetical protein